MIAESLKRRHSGLDEKYQPPCKVRRILYDRLQNSQGANDVQVGEKNTKRQLEIGGTDDEAENVLNQGDRWHNLKRRCLREQVETMQIKASAQYLQSPAKRSKKSRKRDKRSKSQDQQPSTSSSDSQSESPENPAYNDMLFWRPVLPDIEKELARFFEDSMDISDATMTTPSSTTSSDAEDTQEYNAFNFWRVPILDVDLNAIH